MFLLCSIVMKTVNMMSMIRKFISTFLIIVGLFFLMWCIPVKRTINSNFDINEYLNEGEAAVLCHGENSTDVQFVIEQTFGIEQSPKYIKRIEGNSPELFLSRQIDDNYDDVKFLFIGSFDKEIVDSEDSYVFYVNRWYTVGDIERRFNLLWYPKYGFNVFEIKLF